MHGGRVPLEASRSHLPAGSSQQPDPSPSTKLEVSIVVRRRADLGKGAAGRLDAILEGQAPAMSREEATASLGADPSEIERAREFGESEGLSVVEISPERRTIRVSGTVAQFESAFGVKLHTCESGSHRYLCYDGALSIPASLDGIIVAVLGLDQRPVARK